MTFWFDKRPGQHTLASVEHPDPRCDEAILLVMDGSAVPDWVRLPPELGGGQRRVLSKDAAPCVQCRERGFVYALDGDEGYHVSECMAGCGFSWFVFQDKGKGETS